MPPSTARSRRWVLALPATAIVGVMTYAFSSERPPLQPARVMPLTIPLVSVALPTAAVRTSVEVTANEPISQVVIDGRHVALAVPSKTITVPLETSAPVELQAFTNDHRHVKKIVEPRQTQIELRFVAAPKRPAPKPPREVGSRPKLLR